MFKNIVVPLDGSDLAETIYPHVRTMAAAFDARVTLLHVSEAHAAVVDPLTWRLQQAEAEAYLRQQVARLQEAGTAVESCLLEGAVAERIVAYADQQGADLIILSSHGQGGLSEWNVSNIAQKVLQRGITSIFLVPAEFAGYGSAERIDYHRVLLPLDGSRRAECVLPVARTLAERGSSELLLAHVTVRPALFSRTPPTEAETAARAWLIDHNRDGAGDYLRQLASQLAAKVQIALPVDDNVALALHRLVADEAVHLVVLSAHGRTAQSQWPYGSITGNFIANGSVPLLIVQDLPQPLRQQEQRETMRRQLLHSSPKDASYYLSKAFAQ